MKRIISALIFMAIFSCSSVAFAQYDNTLHQRAQDYTDWLIQWHSTGLGGVSDVLFTDAGRTELERLWGSGDSTDWTCMYLVSQAMRYEITGEQEAIDEVERIAQYLHVVKEITGDPGYLARYAGPDTPPWNTEYQGGADFFHLGQGAWDGYFWLGHESRDKYMHWFWAMTWAYRVIDDPAMRATIETDVQEVVDTLMANNWIIIDPWGDIWPAAEIGPDLRLSFLLQVAVITGDVKYWQLLDQEYEAQRVFLWISTFAFFNRYFDYYAFENSMSVWQPIFMLWPDRERLEYLYRVWMFNNRTHVEGTHQAYFDEVWYEACLRLGTCDATEMAWYEQDIYDGMSAFVDPPNYQRAKTCPTLPLDQFSVWADQFLANFPWVDQLFGFDIDPQTEDGHIIADRCWVSVMWERSPHHIECDRPDYPEHVAHGADYLIGYWMGVYYGILPGNGPYGDDDLTDDDDVTDDDDDDISDDDDDVMDDDDNDDSSDDDDDAAPASDNDDDDEGCCG